MKFLAAAAVLLAGAIGDAEAVPTPARDNFRAALTIIESGGKPPANAAAGYVLAPYLDYFYLTHDLRRATSQDVRRYLAEHEELPAARRLLSAWLLHLGREKRWSEYLAFWEPSRDTWLRCYWVTARVRVHGSDDPTLSADALSLWMVGQSQPKACDPAFAYLKSRGELNQPRYYERAMLAIDAGNVGLAHYLSRKLSGAAKRVVDRGVATLQRPAQTLGAADRWHETADHKRIVTAGLSVLARSNSEAANQIWRRLRNHWSWEADVKAFLDRRVALFSATDFPEDALERLSGLSDAATDQTIHEWRVRVALHHQNWRGVIASIDRMPSNLKNKARWRYWRGRALEAQGKTGEAESIFQAVSEETNYYGFLAADRLQRHYAICPLLNHPGEEVITDLLGNEAFHRAVELFHLDRPVLARAEWRLARRSMDAGQRREAALYADAIGWHDQAIHGMTGGDARRYYSVRFPLGYQPQITSAAQRRSLEPALVYGILRSESAFAPDAVSRAGAIGLMQLMPATATRVARAERLPYRGRQDLLNPDQNIELGTAYLESLAERFGGHPLLITAAYNAGPKAVERWLARREPVEPDVWIETLPYRETREYVSKVIAFTAIYDWRLNGRFRRLTHRMLSLADPQDSHVPGRCEA